MITVKNKCLTDPIFNSALRKLELFSGFPPQVAYSVMKISKAVRAEAQVLQETFLKMVKNHANLDEKGEIIPNKDAAGNPVPNSFVIPVEKEAAWEQARKEFDEVQFEIPWRSLKVSSLKDVKLNAMELSAIEQIVEFDITGE